MSGEGEVRVGLPSLAGPESRAHDEDYLDDDEDDEDEGERGIAAVDAVVSTMEPLVGMDRGYEAVEAGTGAPLPLEPHLVTLSLLPRSQWQSLVHLEAIKARNRPIQPPKKPEAAPFFLPSSYSIFGAADDAGGAGVALAGDDSKLPGWGDEEDGDEEAKGEVALGKIRRAFEGPGGANKGAKKSKRARGEGEDEEEEGGDLFPASEFIQLLRRGVVWGAQKGQGKAGKPSVPTKVAKKKARGDRDEGGGFEPLMALLRGMSASAIDREVRSMQVILGEEGRGSDGKELDAMEKRGVKDVELLLSFIASSLGERSGAGSEEGGGSSFEFIQGLLQLTLQVHGDLITRMEGPRGVAQEVVERLQPAWRRLESSIQQVKCMVALFGNIPQS